MTIIERLEEERKRQKKTQKEIAKAMEVDQGSYSNYKKKNQEPNATKLTKAAKYLKIDLQYLITGEAPEDQTLTEEELKIISKYRSLEQEAQELLKKIIDKF